MKRAIRIFLAFSLLMMLVQGCVLKVVKLNIQTDSLQIAVGESILIAYTVNPADSKVSFSTNNDSIATVSSEGLVTAVAQGTTSITVEATRDGFKKALGTVNVTVLPAPLYVITFNVHDIQGAVQGASIVFNSQAKMTDADGKAVFSDVPPGNKTYTVSKTGYHDITGDINVDGNKQVDVSLSRKSYLLTTNTIGQGTIVKSPDKTSYLHGEVVQLTAVPDDGWSFTGWNGAIVGNANPVNITMNADRSVTAIFSIMKLTVTASSNPAAGGSVIGTGVFDYGEVVTLIATPNEGYEFVNWTEDGAQVSLDPEYSFILTTDRSLVANFAVKTYELGVNVLGNGSVQKSPDLDKYLHGEIVELTAEPAQGWSFDSWSGDLEGSQNPASITMNANKEVTATFRANQYTVNVFSSPEEGGLVTGGGSFTFGEEIVVTALANDCYMFIGWYEDGLLVSEENEFCFIVERDIELEARFVNAVKSKEFKFILENLFLGRKYEVTMKLDLRITKVRFIYPNIDPDIQTPIPEEVVPDGNGDVYINSFWTNTEAESILILCYSGDKLVSQCVESLLEDLK